MSARIIDGKAISDEIRKEIKLELKTVSGAPGLAVVLVGDDSASAVYVKMKQKACEELGYRSFLHKLPGDCPEKDLLDLIDVLNKDSSVHGILVQLPVPDHISEIKVINAIDPSKDVDGFHPVNAGRMLHGESDCFLPCTPYGIQELICRTVPDLKGKHLVVVGRSNIVGKPIASMMYQKNPRANCIVTICHSAVKDLAYYTRQADILIAAIGRPELIRADMVKNGAVVIDVGMNRVDDADAPRGYTLVGDVNFDEVSEVASAITPVPKGVGPMTITMLMKNTLQAFKQQNGL